MNGVEPNCNNHITEDDVKLILGNCEFKNKEYQMENYLVKNASNKMLGFLADYWNLKVIVTNNNQRNTLSFFIKAISRSNAAKANMLTELKLFEKELFFYAVIKKSMELPSIRPWSAKLVTALDDAMIFEDLNELNYTLRNKYKRFDMAHTLQALRTLSRFHASSIIYEENRSKDLKRPYRINEDYEDMLDVGAYKNTDNWFVQCKKGALEALRIFSKYSDNVEVMNEIENRWETVWVKALESCNFSSEYRNVVCHRDLWNNNILFHYQKNEDDTYEPDDCLLVDFQAVRSQPPAGDVMLLLYCNLDPKFREQNMENFLNYYHHELKTILCSHGIEIDNILNKEQFFASAQIQRQWGLIACACLIQLFWIDDTLTTDIFSDSAQFNQILCEDKAAFLKKMMETNEDYKLHVMEIFEEVVERYCLCK